EGQQIRVVCYTNSAQARLELNGKVGGETRAYNEEQEITYWDIPYTAGKLEVIRLDDNSKEIVHQHIQSSKRSHAVQVLPTSSTSIRAQGGVAQIELQIVDENGHPVILAEDEITCHVAGNGRLLGMEAGNNSDMGDYTANKQRVYHGKMRFYVQANGASGGKFAVRFSAPCLAAGDAEINFQL